MKFWLSQEFEVSHISQVIEYDRGQPLKPVIESLVELRREGDKSEDTQLLAMVSYHNSC